MRSFDLDGSIRAAAPPMGSGCPESLRIVAHRERSDPRCLSSIQPGNVRISATVAAPPGREESHRSKRNRDAQLKKWKLERHQRSKLLGDVKDR